MIGMKSIAFLPFAKDSILRLTQRCESHTSYRMMVPTYVLVILERAIICCIKDINPTATSHFECILTWYIRQKCEQFEFVWKRRRMKTMTSRTCSLRQMPRLLKPAMFQSHSPLLQPQESDRRLPMSKSSSLDCEFSNAFQRELATPNLLWILMYLCVW